jgi:flagellar basal-body rod modification protein FlgD
MSTTPVSNSWAAFAASSQQKDSASSSSNPLGANGANQQMFLQLLVAQLKNQDPMQPSDGTQFVAQLAQFSELEQVIAIRQDADSLINGKTTTSTDGTSKTGN